MAKFKYQALNREGKKETGLVEAGDAHQATAIIHEKGYFIIDLQNQKEGALLPGRLNFDRVSSDDKINFTRQFSTMISSGLPIINSLAILVDQSRPAMKKIISEISRDVEGGSSLTDALTKHPQVFDRVYLSLVRAGEAAGVLDRVLARLADNLEKNREFNGKIKGAMIYPLIVTVGMVLVAVLMMVVVVPKMTALYADFGTDLPPATKLLMAISNFFVHFWWSLPFLAVGGFFLWRSSKKYPVVEKFFDRLLFRLPIVGKLRHQTILTEFSRTLGLLSGTGILLVEALGIVRDSITSVSYRQAVEQAIVDVEHGSTLSVAFNNSGVFPMLMSQMVAVGEETGKIDEILERVARYYEQEADVSVKGLTTAIEPIIMVVLGLGVGFLMIAMIMPMYSITSQF